MSMKAYEVIQPADNERRFLYLFFKQVRESEKTFLQQSEIADLIEAATAAVENGAIAESPFFRRLSQATCAAFRDPWFVVRSRPSIGVWRHGRFHASDLSYEEIPVGEFMRFQELLVCRDECDDAWGVEFDSSPFLMDVPLMKDRKQIGRGVEYLNRFLSNRLFSNSRDRVTLLLSFLRLHHHRGRQLMLSDRIGEPDELLRAIEEAEEFLGACDDEATWESIRPQMNAIGFEAGWGDTVARVREMIGLLSEVIDAPETKDVEEFLGRIPMIFSVVIFSPHGWFGQSKVLGLPDTGGQVVYILDQVRALEAEMRERLVRQGLDTEPRILVVTRLIPDAGDTGCDEPEEHISGTRNASIIRVPFTTPSGEVVPRWISRFQVWPYLERFTLDAEEAILARLGDKPDLVIGNYSDGNLVATLLAGRLQVTQCNIAHALEKTKYLCADLFWRDMEEEYHFSAHFTADLLAMNAADFIITSTYQEIAGNASTPGQYESYSSFTLPGLYRVPKGIDVFDPKFNIVSPGCDERVYFPYTEEERRIHGLAGDIDLLLHGDFPGAVSRFEDPEKPVIFLMSRLDKVKNVTGFVEWYGQCERLQDLANVFIIGGHTDAGASDDEEESAQIERLHGLIGEHGLEGKVRWVPKQSDKIFNGELYRTVADRRGIFVQPALFEAFGLTVIEAMVSGLPTFATLHGGPLEIIEDGVSGFHVDPNHGAAAAGKMADFFQRCQDDPAHWDAISGGGIKRVEARYTWRLYASRLMTLSRIYGFWKYVTNLDRAGSRAYDRLFYNSVYRPIVRGMEK